MRGRCVSVAEDTADRPVHARTRSGADRRMRGRRTLSSARGRMIGSRMLSLRMREGPEKQIAPPTLQTNRRDSPAAERNERATAAPSIGTRLPARKLVTILLESTIGDCATSVSRGAHDAVHAAYVTVEVSPSHRALAQRFGPDMSSLQRKIGGPALDQHLSADGFLPAHSTDGPVTIHVLDGSVTFSVLDQDYPLAAGDVLILAAGVRHSARSADGVRFLLTVVQPPAESTEAEEPGRERSAGR